MGNSSGIGKPGTGGPHPGIRTFLIADVRGYTLFTQERGDEAATKLAARFAEIAREVVNEHGGSVIELRGDEALAVFDSARQAIVAASHAQNRFLQETLADPSFPLPVGIGLDAGEAVPLETGYRGGALNLAARLCGRAGPGEILASQGVTHLARKVEGVRYVDRGDLHLKGLADSVRVFRVIPEEGDPAEGFRQLAPGRSARAPAPIRAARRHPTATVLVALALVAAAVVPATIAIRGGGASEQIPGDALGIIDLESAEPIGSVPLESRPGAVAIGEGGVWVTLPDRGVVVEIDADSRSVIDTVQVGADPVAIAAGNGSVWVANAGSGTVSRISPAASNEVVDNIDVPGGPAAIAVGQGGIWVANSLSDSVSRIDPDKGEVVATIPVDDQPFALTVDDGGLWVANARSGTVSHVGSGPQPTVERTQAGNGPRAIAVGLDAVWVANFLDGTVNRIDPETGSIDQTIPVGPDPTGLALGAGSVWVSSGSEGSVKRIDPESGVGAPITLGSQSGGIATGNGELWVGVRGPESAHRGGTLTVEGLDFLMDSIDPAVAYSVLSWNLLSLTNDGLLGFKRIAGIDGATLVPALATAIPEPTDGGRTYTFRLRSGIRYSTGEPVRPEDFRRAIERVFANLDADGNPSGGVGYFSDIVGADDCIPGSPCDLSAGIVADDEVGTVTFHLEHSDPDFPLELTMPFAFAAPAGTPDTLAVDTPVPATGPYFIERYTAGEEIVLGRNPEFGVWSPSRPDGFPDQIIWRLGPRLGPMVDATLGGSADLMINPPPERRLEELMKSHRGQLHFDPQSHTGYVFLNNDIPPFDDERVRRALNYAVDRQALVHEVFGAQAVVTCQILPPVLPGYDPYCPYTSNPDGTWTAPDLAKSQRLIDRSGTAGARVTVWASPDSYLGSVEVGEHIVDLLQAIGYRASLKVVKELPARMQIGYAAWGSDYPAESGFISPNLVCDSAFNVSQFCDPDIDARMEQATRLAATNPAESHVLWSDIEHDLVDRAPWVPLMNRTWVSLVSLRLGNYQFNPAWGPLIDQMWVR
jgi:YVTN family beta-propeller protein